MKTFPIPSSPAGPGGEDKPKPTNAYAMGGMANPMGGSVTPRPAPSGGGGAMGGGRAPSMSGMAPAMNFAKGGDVKSCSYAVGGPVYGRTRDFLKEPVEFRDPNEGKRQSQDVVGDTADKDQKYEKSGIGSGKGIHAPPPEKSKSAVKTPMPRK